MESLYFCVVDFYVNDEQDLYTVRDIFASHLRKLNLRYKSEKVYPLSGWNTPAIGVPLEVYFLIKKPKDRPIDYKAQVKELKRIARSIAKDHEGVVKTTIETEEELTRQWNQIRLGQ